MSGKRKRRNKRIKPVEVVLAPPGYQPSKAEIDEEVRLPCTPTQLAKAMMQEATITRRD